MPAIGKDVNENYYNIYCKGSPEKIKNYFSSINYSKKISMKCSILIRL